MSKTSLAARQYHLRKWASMIRECNQRPVGMSVDEWCNSHSITKANYYYRMKQVRKACLEAIPKEPAEQSVVPVPAELMNMEIPADATQIQSGQSVSASLEIKVNDMYPLWSVYFRGAWIEIEACLFSWQHILNNISGVK